MQLDTTLTAHPLPGADGVCVKPLEPGDRATYLAGFARLSPTARYLRFAAPKPRLTSADLERLLDVDHERHEALIACECESGEPVGIVRYVRDADEPTRAEVAITVLDEWQGRGIGARMLEELSRSAAERGVERLHADVLRANGRALGLLRQAGWRVVATDGLMVTLERSLS